MVATDSFAPVLGCRRGSDGEPQLHAQKLTASAEHLLRLHLKAVAADKYAGSFRVLAAHPHLIGERPGLSRLADALARRLVGNAFETVKPGLEAAVESLNLAVHNYEPAMHAEYLSSHIIDAALREALTRFSAGDFDHNSLAEFVADHTRKVVAAEAQLHGDHVLRGLLGSDRYDLACADLATDAPAKLLDEPAWLALSDAAMHEPGSCARLAGQLLRAVPEPVAAG